MLCGETFAKLDNFVWRRVYRWAQRRHSDKTGRWIIDRYFPHRQGEPWQFTDPATGKHLFRVREVVKPQRSLKVKGVANPFDPAWEAYFHDRDRKLALQASSPFRATLLRQQHGLCPGCRQVSQGEEEVELHHRDGQHQHNQLGNLVLLHPTCHRQELMHQNLHLHRRVLHGALVMLERSAGKLARSVLRGERSREAPDLPGGHWKENLQSVSYASLWL